MGIYRGGELRPETDITKVVLNLQGFFQEASASHASMKSYMLRIMMGTEEIRK
jgi:hypothetical protein